MKKILVTIRQNSRDIVLIIEVFLLASILLYGYYAFFTPEGMSFVYRNWDGPDYVVVAKTFYDVNLINKINPFPFLAPSHYAFQFPFYPIFIRLFSFIGYNKSMLFVSQLFSLLFIIVLYFLVKTVSPKANALVVALLAIFYTPRWFIVSHVGSSEPQFLFFITLFMLCAYQRKYLLSAVFVALAQLTKSQGIVFFVGIAIFFAVQLLTRKKTLINTLKEFTPYLLIPITLIAVCTLYYFKYGNFFIYLGNETFPALQWPPLKILTATRSLFRLTHGLPIYGEIY